MIRYIAFIPGISLSVGIDKVITMDNYNSEKHARHIDVEENSAGFEFWIKKDGKRTGERIRVMRSAVASVRETVEVKK